MDKIVTHPLYFKAQKVVASCNRSIHYEVAEKYLKLIKKHINRDCYESDAHFIVTEVMDKLDSKLQLNCFSEIIS